MSVSTMPVIQVFSAGVSGKKAGAVRLSRTDVLRAIQRNVGDGQFVNIAPAGQPQVAAIEFSIPNVGPGSAGTMVVLVSDIPELIEAVRAIMENPDSIGVAKEVDAEHGADTFNRTVSVNKDGLISFMPAPGHGQGSATDWGLDDVRALGAICAGALHNDLGGYTPALDPQFVAAYVPVYLIDLCRNQFKFGDRIVNFDTSLHPAYRQAAPAEVSADVAESVTEAAPAEVSAAADDAPPADVTEDAPAAIQAETPAGKGPRRAKNNNK